MKRAALVILLISTLFTACKKDAINSKVDNSYSTWVTFRNQHNNNYSYVSYGSSVFGYHSETKLIIQDGKITSREFTSGMYKPNTDSLVVNTTWIEQGNTLNTHEGAAELLTIDQIYTKAMTVWLKADTKSNDVYFDVDTRGIIASAGYVPKGCQDDCFIGVNIKDVSAL